MTEKSQQTKRTERIEDLSRGERTGGAFSQVGSEFQPFISDTAQAAQNTFNLSDDFVLPDIQRTTPLTPDQEAALGVARNRVGFNPVVDAAANSLTSTLQGGGLNPFAQLASDTAGQNALEAVQDQFTLAGRNVGSTAERNASIDAITRAQAPFLFGAAENQANRQLQASQLAPGVSQAQFAPAQNLFNLGAFQQGRGDQLAQEQFQDELFPLQNRQAATQNLVNQVASLFPAFGQESGDFSTFATDALRTGDSTENTQSKNSLFNTILGTGLLLSGIKIPGLG